MSANPGERQYLDLLGEVLAHCSHEDRLDSDGRQPERDVGGASASADLKIFYEERQGDLVELIDHDRISEETGIGREVVGGNRPSDGNRHVTEDYRSVPLVTHTASRLTCWR